MDDPKANKNRRGSAAATKEKKMDNGRHVERALSVLTSNQCKFLIPSDPAPRTILFMYEKGAPDGGFRLISPVVSKEAGHKILSWLRANADPDEFGCGIQQADA
jgi:hypothetical protein